MQADEDRVGFQGERVADAVMPAGKIKHGMRIDGVSDRGGVVGFSVAYDAERVDIHPVWSWRQRGDRRRQRSGKGAERSSIVARTDGASHSLTGHDEPVVEIRNLVDRA